MRSLKVVGTASKKVNPDRAKVFMNVVAEANTADLANSVFKNKARILSTVLKQLKLKEDNLITEHYNVGKNYQYENNKKVDKGYIVRCTYSYDMPLDYDMLEKLIESMSVALDINITYDAYLAEAEKVNNEVLALAFEDAKNKASVLAKTCKVKLKDIAEIYYGDGPSYVGLRAVRESSLAPSEVEVSKTIEISWEIE